MYISVIVAAHNEERYIARALEALRASLAKYEHEIIVVCDRCTDRTPEIGSKLGDKVVIKNESKWSNSYAENLAIGLAEATGEYIAIVDADMVVEEQYFAKVLDAFKDPGVASVSGRVITEGSTLFNRLYSLWERTYDLFGSRRPRGGNRVFRADVLRKIGFRDVIAPDTDLDLRMPGDKVYLDNALSYHIREITLRKCIRGQISSGKARRQLHISFFRTLLHGILRLRPFVIVGYIISSDCQTSTLASLKEKKR